MPTNKKPSKPEPSNKKMKDSTLSDAQATRVKGGRINTSGDPDILIP